MPSEIFNDQFDVIVIGAGINGAGIARDAAMRGLKVLLLDKGDIGSGTSSWSTRLIHGGLRYLEYGELGLVRESLRERECLMKIAPHLVRPLRILVPMYKHGQRGVWKIRAGMIAYDVLSLGKSLPHHRMLTVSETLQQAPGLNRKDLLGAAVYFDAQVEYAERLVLENALSAVEHGATVITYARVDKFQIQDGKVCGVEFTRLQSPPSNVQRLNSGVQDEMSRGEEGGLAPALTPTPQGSSPIIREGSDVEHHSASAPIVINAAGPWIDQVLGANGQDSSRRIGGTKGSHLIVAPFGGAPENTIYVEAETDRRPFFIIPWNGNYLIGTTDIRYDADPDHVRIEAEEIEYLLRETNRVIPNAQLTRAQILYTYSGVRPLPFVTEKDEQSITRKHFIRASQHLDNLFSIVGGKLTTYRSLAEETVDLIFKRLGRSKPACTTIQAALPGAVARRRAAGLCELPEATSHRLARIYGTRSSEVAQLISDDPSLNKVFDQETGAIAAEVVFAFKHELAQTLSDCLLRRTMVGLNSTCGLKAVDAAASIAQKHLGWSASRVAQETGAYRMEISGRFRR
ncbi:MAG: glycerol-3-phosphate dehydrogenase/oxidase [Blastocatellia bacterium]|nr:glycerol-3-phosphate dehydrogenase/oxidase [Blastocatellia bacterium]